MAKITAQQLYQIMFDHMGPQGWWPGESKFEVAIGAVLVQNTNWKNVEYSLDNLRRTTFLQPQKIHALAAEQLQLLIQPSGFYKNKARCLVALFDWLADSEFSWEKLTEQNTDQLRPQLLALPGIGAETADSILLYCLDKPVFIADSYTHRIFNQLGVTNFNGYSDLKTMVAPELNLTLTQYKEYHGLLDDFGKQYLKKWSSSFLAPYQLILPSH